MSDDPKPIKDGDTCTFDSPICGMDAGTVFKLTDMENAQSIGRAELLRQRMNAQKRFYPIHVAQPERKRHWRPSTINALGVVVTFSAGLFLLDYEASLLVIGFGIALFCNTIRLMIRNE